MRQQIDSLRQQTHVYTQLSELAERYLQAVSSRATQALREPSYSTAPAEGASGNSTEAQGSGASDEKRRQQRNVATLLKGVLHAGAGQPSIAPKEEERDEGDDTQASVASTAPDLSTSIRQTCFALLRTPAGARAPRPSRERQISSLFVSFPHIVCLMYAHDSVEMPLSIIPSSSHSGFHQVLIEQEQVSDSNQRYATKCSGDELSSKSDRDRSLPTAEFKRDAAPNVKKGEEAWEEIA